MRLSVGGGRRKDACTPAVVRSPRPARLRTRRADSLLSCSRPGIRLGVLRPMSAPLVSHAGHDRTTVGDRIEALRRREHAGVGLYIGALALVALLYYGAGRIGLELASLEGAVAALWPPAGLGLAVLFLYGLRLWPAIVIGDLALADFHTPMGTVLAQTLGNTLALVVAALLLRRLTGGRGGAGAGAGVVPLLPGAALRAGG